jgi:hypothetical protein
MPSFRLLCLCTVMLTACADDPMASRKSYMDAYESRFDSAADAVSDISRNCPRYISVHSDIVAADRVGQDAAIRAHREAESATVLAYVNRRSSDLLLRLADKAVQNRCFSEADYLYDVLLRTAGDPLMRERARQKKAEALVLRDSTPRR